MTIAFYKKPEVVVALCAGLWGLFWIPLRAIESQGFTPAWVALSQFVAPLLVLIPIAAWWYSKHKSLGLNQWIKGVLIGSAFALYAESLLLTDVVRALILFYVMPVWGTLIEVFFMRRRFTIWRAIALVLGLSGLITILNLHQSFELSLNLGDCMSLLSGICFTIGAMMVRDDEQTPIFEQVFSFFFYGALLAFALTFIPTGVENSVPSMDSVITLLPWLLAMGILFLIPMMFGIYWGAQFVDPGRLGILLQLEAVVGIFSAALLTDETFGTREAVGACLVISAGVVEVLGNKSKQ